MLDSPLFFAIHSYLSLGFFPVIDPPKNPITVNEINLTGFKHNGSAIINNKTWIAIKPLKSAAYEISVDCNDVGTGIDVYYGEDFIPVIPEDNKYNLTAGEIYYIGMEFDSPCQYTLEVNAYGDTLLDYVDFRGDLTIEKPSYWASFSPEEDGLYELYCDNDEISFQIFDSSFNPLTPYDMSFAGIEGDSNYYALSSDNIS